MPPRFLFLLFLLAPLVLAGCEEPEGSAPPARTEPEIPFDKEGTLTFYRPGEGDLVTIDIEIAETDSARARGLMQRSGLPERSGMLFPMPTTERHGFWMANTPLSLDITFVSPDSTVINTVKYTRPFSTENVMAEAPARFVIETTAGFTDDHGIAPGDRVRWSRE